MDPNFFNRKWRLSACRVNAGYTQKEVAKLVGVSEKTVVDWESGKTAPKMESAQKLSELFLVPLAYMDFTKDGNRVPLKDRKLEDGEGIPLF